MSASRGDKGILAHPPTPPIFNVKLIFPNFFCLNQQKQNHSPKIPFYVCDQAQLFLLILTQKTHTFLCMRSSRTLKKSHKISPSFSIGGVGGFPPVSPYLPY